ncbi:MAG TPA: hypothetical protein VFQ65_21045 [Kofleriaceae bacterium]|nr:hypothetical protein [Kofleriaceae bacterium]
MRYVLACAVLVATSAVARADEKADCDYLEIAASNSKTPAIDGELKPLDKKLKKPPFASWNTFHKLSGGPVSLSKQKADSLRLAQGGASILLRDRSDKKLELTVTIDGADGKRVLDNKQSVPIGEWSMFVHTAKDDGHILALTCK